VSSIAGTTRDRRECWGRIGGTEFTLMDTAGVDGDRIQLLSKSKTTSKHAVERAMMEQTLEAAKQSDLVLLLWDAKVGVTQDLEVTARWLRKLGKDSNVAILANKLEGDSWAYDGSPVREHLDDINRLGLGEAIPISALQGDGMADIGILVEQLKAKKLEESGYDRVEETLSALEAEDDDEEKPLQMAVLGRQNVGKSTLVNTLLKSERVLTGPTPGLTRDAIAVEWTWKDKPIQLVDTAGIRKMTRRLDDSIEDMSVADALRAMKVAEVAVLVLDAEALFLHRQELAICNAVIEEGRALVIAANKMDLLEMSSKYTPQDFANGVQEQLEQRIPILRNTPVVPMSCLSGEGIDDLLPVVLDARDRWARTISTGLLNRWLKEVVDGARTPMVKGIPAKLKYIIQTKGRPPTFIIFSNVDELPDAYLRYLTKHFQESFELYGMPVRIIVQKSAKQNPYDKEKKQRSGFGLGGRDARQRRRVQGYIAKRKTVRKTN
jgi:GTP-binding protein